MVFCNQWFAQCENKTVICGEGDCRIYCGNQGCVNSEIHCPDRYECIIYCRGYRACYQALINGGNASSLSVITEDNNGNRQIEGATIYCGTASCNVTCSKEFQVCYQATIYAQHTNSLSVECATDLNQQICNEIAIYCPHSGSCDIIGQPTTAGMRYFLFSCIAHWYTS